MRMPMRSAGRSTAGIPGVWICAARSSATPHVELNSTATAVRRIPMTQLESNKKMVVEFYEKAINDKDFDAASKYLGSRYTQHNPGGVDGPEGLKGFLQFLKKSFPQSRSEIKRVF